MIVRSAEIELKAARDRGSGSAHQTAFRGFGGAQFGLQRAARKRALKRNNDR